MKTLKIATLLILSASLSTATAQKSLNAAGGDASGMGGKASYSLGQIVYTTNSANTGSAAQGVQQTFEISVVSGIEDAEGIDLTISAYPNPSTDYLTLRFKDNINTNFDMSTWSYQLYNINGELIQNGIITSNQTNIIMRNLAPSSYFVKVIKTHDSDYQQEVKTFKIIKVQ